MAINTLNATPATMRTTPITELRRKFGQRPPLDAVGNFVSLFDRIGRYRCEILVEVPRTTAPGVPERCHDIQ